MTELTTKEKWANVDRIIESINRLKQQGIKTVQLSRLQQYIDKHFNKQTK